MEVDELDTPQSAPEEDDDDVSISSSGSSSPLPSESDDEGSESPMDTGYSGKGMPVLDEVSKSKKGREHDEGPESPLEVNISIHTSPTTPRTPGNEVADRSSRETPRKPVTPDSIYAQPSALQQHLNRRNNEKAKSIARMSMDDHGELDFDESDDDEESRRDWKSEARTETKSSKTQEKEEGEESSDDEIDIKTNQQRAYEKDDVQDPDDCEEGEIKSEDEDTSSPDEEALDKIENPQAHLVYDIDDRPFCRFYQRGNCHFGMNCRFLHPGMNDMPPPHMGPPPGMRGPPPSGWAPEPAREPSPPPSPARASPPTESAWERGLRHAKKMRELAKKRKEKETNFEEKRMNLSVEVLDDEKIVTEKKKPESVVEVPPPKEKDSRENKENERRFNIPNSYEDKGPVKPDPYYDDPKIQRDPYYDPGYGGDYYQPEGEWDRGPPHYDVYQARQWNREPEQGRPWDREPDYPPPAHHFRKDYPPPKEKYTREPDYHEPYHKEPPPENFSPEREREYWDRRREEDYKKYKKYKALRDNREDEQPVNRVRGEEWSDPWARVREPQRRNRSGSRSRSRGRRRKRSLSGSSSSYTSSSYSSRSRSRSSSYSSSYSSRSSYSRSSSFSSRSRSRTPTRRSKPSTNTLAPPGKKVGPKTLEGPPKSTVTKVGTIPDDRRRPPPSGPPPGAREPMRERQGQETKGPPKGPPPGRSGGPPPKSGPPTNRGQPPNKPPSKPVTHHPPIKGGPPPTSQKENTAEPGHPGPKPALAAGALAADRARKDRRNMPGRMRRRPSRSYSSSSSSRSRSRGRHHSRSRSRSSRSSSSSSSTSSSSSSSGSSGSESGRSRGGGPRQATREPPLKRKAEDLPRSKMEPDMLKGKQEREERKKPELDGRLPRQSQDIAGRKDRETIRDKQKTPTAQQKQDRDRFPDSRRVAEREDRGVAERSLKSASQKQPDPNEASAQGQKSGIKLTLKSDKIVQRPQKRTVSNGSTEEPDVKKGKQTEEPQEKSKKVKESPSAGSKDSTKKKSTSSRREELLKQLKAVENAIYRKRSKLS